MALNIRGFKANIDYVNHIFNSSSLPLILCVSEHWLHTFDHHLLSTIERAIDFTVESVSETEDTYVPNLRRGRSGVAILWSANLSPIISVISQPRSDRLVGIRLKALPNDIILFSVYLPCRTGCTDHFKEVLDQLDAILSLYTGAVVLFAGDFNANPGPAGGPRGNTPNEQGLILARYLSLWDYVSVHLHSSTPNIFYSCQ